MTEKDEQMLKDFLKPAAQQEIEDNGFTESVMSRLPAAVSPKEQVVTPQEIWLSRIWTVLCTCLALVLFFSMNGWSAARTNIEVMLQTIPTQLHPLSAILCATATCTRIIVMTMQRERITR